MIVYQPAKYCQAIEVNVNKIFVVRNDEVCHIAVEEAGPEEPLFMQGAYNLVSVFRNREDAVRCYKDSRIAELLGRMTRYRLELRELGYDQSRV